MRGWLATGRALPLGEPTLNGKIAIAFINLPGSWAIIEAAPAKIRLTLDSLGFNRGFGIFVKLGELRPADAHRPIV